LGERATDDEIEKALAEIKGPDGVVTCAEALGLAARLEVEPLRVGEACNRLEIKIRSCQLGLFP
jgi:hypothetical protein